MTQLAVWELLTAFTVGMVAGGFIMALLAISKDKPQ